jgi:hypothetical protein
MSLLAPWFLAGLALVAGPIIAHLIRRATRDRVVFSSLRFLETSPPRLDRRSHVQNPWLLALRCLIVALLAFGFARPFLNHADSSPRAPTPVRHVVAVLDESASMQRSGLWDAARARVNAIVAGLNEGDQFVLLAAGARITELISSTQWLHTTRAERPALIRAVLAGRQPGWGPSPLDSAAETALARWEDMTENAAAVPSRRELIIVSDFAAGARTAGLASLEWPAHSAVILDEVTPAVAGNASLHWLGWSETPGTPVAARVRLTRSFDAPEALSLQWRDGHGGATLGEPQPVTLLPGASEVRLVPLPKNPPAALRLDLRGDAQDFDNHLWLLRAPPRSLALTYLGSEAANDPRHTRFYLQRAVSGWREPVAQMSTALPDSGASSALVIVNSPLDAERVRDLHRRMEAGAFVLVLLADPSRVPIAASLADETGWTAVAPARSDALLGQLDFQHPLFAPFADPAYSDFTRIHFWKPQGVALPASSRSQVVARFDDNTPAVIETTVGRGRLIAWGGDWSPASSQWVLSSKFVPWLQALAERAAGGIDRAAMAEIGDTTRLLSGPAPAEWRHLDGSASPSASASAPDLPGLYQLKQGDEVREVALLVPAAESNTQRLPLDTWEQLGVPLRIPDAVAASPIPADHSLPKTSAVALENQQGLWRWLLWLTVALLAAESVVSFALARRASNVLPAAGPN